MSKAANEIASDLETLLPAVMVALFRVDGDDPLATVPMGQLRMLRRLERGSKTASDLGTELGLSPSALTQMANRLLNAGLIVKADDSVDRRMRWLSLTDKGKRLMRDRHNMRVKSATEVLKNFPIHRQQELVGLIEEMIASRDLSESAAPQPAVAI